jgi:hypothetical protein
MRPEDFGEGMIASTKEEYTIRTHFGSNLALMKLIMKGLVGVESFNGRRFRLPHGNRLHYVG